ncbi:MAG: zinc ribbon domain-containing protein [Lachnospiraceae bacterium]|nr:zinc ribbon domain-containing protein [Lachnospiraceae bacterium]
MKYCPECGFELKPGDEFCINCGASLIDYKDADKETSREKTPGKPKKSFFKTPGGIILIVVAAIAAAAGVAFLAYFNLPKNKLLRAAKNTVEDVSEMKNVKILNRVFSGGSIEAKANLQDLMEDFSIPLIGQIDATASVKYYMDAENDSCELNAAGGLGGSEALGLDIWADPHRVIIKSPALIGKTAYGFEMSDDNSRKELEGLLEEYLNIDMKPYDEYEEIIDIYSKNKKELAPEIGLELYNQAFKNGEVDTGKEEIMISGESSKTEVIRLSLSGEQLRTVLNNTYEKLRDEENIAELAELIEEKGLNKKIEKIPDDYRMDYKFYINSNMRLVRIDAGADKVDTIAVIGPDPADAKELSLILTENGNTVSLSYKIERDDEKEYLSHISFLVPKEITEQSGFLRANVSTDELIGDISWDKTTERWTFETNFGFSSEGDLKYNNGRADGVIRTLAFESWETNPNVDIVIREEDKMPETPEYRAVRTEEDKNSLISDITDSITQIAGQLLGNTADFVLNQIFGIEMPEEAPEEPEAAEPEQPMEKEQTEEELEEIPEEKLNIGGFEISTKDLAMVQSILNMFGVNVDLSGMDIPAIQSLIDSLGLDEIDPAVIQGVMSMIGVDPSILQPAVPQLNKDEKKEEKTDSQKDDTIDNKEESVQTKGTFADETCELRLNADGTYLLTVFYGQMNYEDSGTFIRNNDDTMEFSSGSGMNATGKLFNDHIEVNIPGFGNFSIPKK